MQRIRRSIATKPSWGIHTQIRTQKCIHYERIHLKARSRPKHARTHAWIRMRSRGTDKQRIWAQSGFYTWHAVRTYAHTCAASNVHKCCSRVVLERVSRNSWAPWKRVCCCDECVCMSIGNVFMSLAVCARRPTSQCCSFECTWKWISIHSNSQSAVLRGACRVPWRCSTINNRIAWSHSKPFDGGHTPLLVVYWFYVRIYKTKKKQLLCY